MSENTPNQASTQSRQTAWRRLAGFLFSPRRVFAALPSEKGRAWLMPMLCLSLALLLRVAVGGFLQAQAAAMGELTLPRDWQWWTPEMQENYMRAVQATQGPTFVFIIPAALGLSGLWAGWAMMAGLLHLTSTLLGGRGSMSSALHVVAWAGLPLALRDLLRSGFMLAAGHPIASPGLSGFVAASDPAGIFLAQLLSNLDIFVIWQAVLLVLGFKIVDNLSAGKSATGILFVFVLLLLAQAGLGSLASRLGGMMITRPFF
jgi:hypothetical protein